MEERDELASAIQRLGIATSRIRQAATSGTDGEPAAGATADIVVALEAVHAALLSLGVSVLGHGVREALAPPL